MKALFIILFLPSLFSVVVDLAFAESIPNLEASKDLPLEFQFLVEGLESFNLTPGDQKLFQEELRELDRNLRIVPKKYFFFVLKSEIYKGIFNHSISVEASSFKIDEKSIGLLNQRLVKDFNKYLSFSRWLIESLQSDLWELSGPSPTGQKVKMATRLKILRPWYEFILQTDAKKFNESIRPLMKGIFGRISQTITFMVQYSRFKVVPSPGAAKAVNGSPGKDEPMTFFSPTTAAAKVKDDASAKAPIKEGIVGVDDSNDVPEKADGGEFLKYQEAKKAEAKRIIGELNVVGGGKEDKDESVEGEGDVLGWRPVDDRQDVPPSAAVEIKEKKREDLKGAPQPEALEWKPR